MECRFGKNITYNVVYEEREESRHSREAEYKVQRIIDEIAARGAAKTEKTEAVPAETPAEKNEKEAETKQEKKNLRKSTYVLLNIPIILMLYTEETLTMSR